jgi:hypothetical protein
MITDTLLKVLILLFSIVSYIISFSISIQLSSSVEKNTDDKAVYNESKNVIIIMNSIFLSISSAAVILSVLSLNNDTSELVFYTSGFYGLLLIIFGFICIYYRDYISIGYSISVLFIGVILLILSGTKIKHLLSELTDSYKID